MKIYAEWTICGDFDNGFFDSWESWNEFSFCPDIEVLDVEELH